jgi:proline iminopeptidase
MLSHPKRVSEIILFGVTTGHREEFDWWFRGGAAILFPAQWGRLRDALPMADREGDIVEAYARRLNDGDPEARRRTATEWCRWESATLAWPPSHDLAPRFRDSDFAIAFARIVIHYVRHNGFLEDGILLRGADAIADTPGIMVNGRLDIQAPIGWAWELNRVWPRARMMIVEDAGHDASNESITRELVRATDEFAPGRG